MARFFLASNQLQNGQVTISGADAHHISRVLRLQKGDTIECVFQKGPVCLVELTKIAGQIVEGRILQTKADDRESPLRLTLFQGLAKGAKMDFVVQKAVELGVREIIPYSSRYTVVKLGPAQAEARLQRWNRIAQEAAKQCGRTRLPFVSGVQSFAEVLVNVERRLGWGELVLVPFEGEKERGLKEIEDQKPEAAAVLIGPEGGFHGQEVQELVRRGASVITLGPRILRTETAGLVALSLLGYKWGDLG